MDMKTRRRKWRKKAALIWNTYYTFLSDAKPRIFNATVIFCFDSVAARFRVAVCCANAFPSIWLLFMQFTLPAPCRARLFASGFRLWHFAETECAWLRFFALAFFFNLNLREMPFILQQLPLWMLRIAYLSSGRSFRFPCMFLHLSKQAKTLNTQFIDR